MKRSATGCSSNEPWCELTPNEFAKLNMKKYKHSYRVCIVTNALGKKSKLWQFRFVDEKGGWRDNNDNTLVLTERIAAFGSVARKS